MKISNFRAELIDISAKKEALPTTNDCLCRFEGEHIVAGEDIYGGTSRLLSRVVPEAGVEVTNVDHTDLVAYERAFIPGRTKLVMLESPTNPRMQVSLFYKHAQAYALHMLMHCVAVKAEMLLRSPRKFIYFYHQHMY